MIWHHHIKDHVEIGPLTKFDVFRVNIDQVMDLEIWFKIHTNVTGLAFKIDASDGESMQQNSATLIYGLKTLRKATMESYLQKNSTAIQNNTVSSLKNRGWTWVFDACFSLTLFSKLPLIMILWPAKSAASKLLAQASVFEGLADVCAIAMATSVNKSRILKSVLFICKKIWSLDFFTICIQKVCNEAQKLTLF